MRLRTGVGQSASKGGILTSIPTSDQAARPCPHWPPDPEDGASGVRTTSTTEVLIRTRLLGVDCGSPHPKMIKLES